MKRFIEGDSRTQGTLFPDTLEDYIATDNPVRVIDVFIDELDLGHLGFEGIDPADTGRPAYHPSTLLKIYVYGYLNRIQSSRRLECETQRNVELMWLTGRLMPDFKTIADFRKDNGEAIRAVCREFVVLCRQLDLLTEAIVAIDGSKFKAVNNRDKNYTRAKLKKRMQVIEESINAYLVEMDRADLETPSRARAKTARLQDKIATLKEEMQRLKKLKTRIEKAPDQQISLTDPDARSMKTRGQGIVGYNVQTAVETKHHIIVAHDVTNTGSDRRQLSRMAIKAQTAMGKSKLTVIADRGYYQSEEILACDEAGITPCLPKPHTVPNPSKRLFDRSAFRYLPTHDAYRCPAGKRLTWRFQTVEHGLTLHGYLSSACTTCSLKAQCTTGQYRRIKRWEHEAVLDAMQRRLDRRPDAMRTRRETVEHPFGTIKSWMGSTHFLLKTLAKVRTEMSLHILAYNMKRVMNIFDIPSLITAIRA